VIWTLMVRQVPVNAAALTALGLALAGLASFALGKAGGLSAMRMDAAALSFPVLASVAFVVMSYAARSLSRGATPLAVAGAGLTLSSLMLLPALPWLFPAGGGLATAWVFADSQVLLLLLYLGLGPTALAYFCYCAGMARCKSAISGLIATMIEPVVAAALSMVLLHERLTSGELAGCMLLMLAMTVLWHGDRPKVTMPLGEPAE
jgi:DME family drug/metabolite transporter